jgi:VanZ family protein
LNRVLAYLPAGVWAAMLLFLGGRRNVPTVESPLPLDKAAHFLLYGLLGALATWGWQRAGRRPRLIAILAVASLVGIADELNQGRVDGRTPEIADWLADTLGIAAAALLILRFTREKQHDVV